MAKTIKIQAKKLGSLKDKTLGLITYNNPEPVMIRTRFGIHTFAVRFAIDVLILDNKNTVVKLKQDLYPNRIFLYNPIYSRVLELPCGYIKQHQIKVGDNILINYVF